MVPPPPPPPPAPPQVPGSTSSTASSMLRNPAGTVTHSTSTSVKAVEGRSQLLSSIRAGKQLKKTITIDKSGPLIPKKSQTNSDSASRINQTGSRDPTNLGGLFAGGIPSLRPTNSRFSSNSSVSRQNVDKPANDPPHIKFPKQSPDQISVNQTNADYNKSQVHSPVGFVTSQVVQSTTKVCPNRSSDSSATSQHVAVEPPNIVSSTTSFSVPDRAPMNFGSPLTFEASFESRFTFQAELPPPEPFNTSLSKNYPSKKEKGIVKPKAPPPPKVQPDLKPSSSHVPPRPAPGRPAPLPPMTRSAPDRPPPPRPTSRPPPPPPPRKK